MEQTLIENLKRSDLREAGNILTLLKSGASIEFESATEAIPSALLETYQARSVHLARFDAHHATRLKKSTDEFCENLASCDQEQFIAYARVDDTLLGSYIIWYSTNQYIPIGCLYVIGKSEVSSDVWENLWREG